MRYTHILFDHDGVLVDTEHLYFRATSETLATVGIDLSMHEYLAIQAEGANAWSGMIEAGYPANDIQSKKAQRNELYQHYLKTEDIDIPNVLETLALLKQTFGLAIVTTSKQADFDLIHEHRSIVDYMDFVLTNKDYARAKPYPDPYLTALHRFGIEAESALVVEDSERGLRSALAAGIDCAMVYHEFTSTQDFSAANYQIGEFSDLLELLDVRI